MVILQEILVWSETLPYWQRDALRRLVLKTSLDPRDLEELTVLLKKEAGIPIEVDLEPEPLKQEHFPTQETNREGLVLLEIRNLKNVNQIAEDQKIVFAKNGITIVYGDNGTGKSGYARVLKQACRARDQNEDVLPDVFLPLENQGVPEAIFVVERNGVRQKYRWNSNGDSPEELASISVFDSKCARLYVTEEGETAFMPYGIDVIQRLADEVYPTLSSRIEEEMKNTQVGKEQFDDLIGERTSVGKFLVELDSSTSSENIEKQLNLTDGEMLELEGLRRIRSEVDVGGKILRLNRLKSRVDRCRNELLEKFNGFDSSAEKLLKTNITSLEDLGNAYSIAVKKLQENDELLEGTGSSEWRILFEAARAFSTSAYPNAEFPHTGEGSKCVLCQQELQDGGERLLRFEEFVRSNVAEKLKKAEELNERYSKKCLEEKLSFGVSEELIDEIKEIDQSFPEVLERDEEKFEKYVLSLRRAIEERKIEFIEKSDVRIIERFDEILEEIGKQIDRIENSIKDNGQRTLTTKLQELSARKSLVDRGTALRKLHRNLIHAEKLANCERMLNTRGVSEKCRALTNSIVTSELREALKIELSRLDINHLSVDLKVRVEKGKSYQYLTLGVPGLKNIGTVLSEGEQRALAIAAFFSELRLVGVKNPIVFDDPVSSLDHSRRGKVATRLIQEAKERQVVVFTHDSTFLALLREEGERQELEERVSYLEWRNGGSGFVVDGLPWGHKTVAERFDYLEKLQRRMEASWSPVPNEDQRATIQSAYNSFRATIERITQDNVLNGVVRRFSDWVKVDEKSLRPVTRFSEDDCDEILRLHKIACDQVSAHDKSSEGNLPVRTPVDFRVDVNDLKDFWNEVKKR